MADTVLKEKRKLFVESVDKGLINGLLDDLLEVKVLNQEEMEIVREENKTIRDQARRLIDIVIRKGSKASQYLIKSIIERDGHLADHLALSSGSQTEQLPTVSEAFSKKSSSSPVPQAIQANATDTLKLCSHEDFQRLRKKMAGQIYPVKEKEGRTRLALIICNIEFEHLSERTGAELDIQRMKILLEELGYSVVILKNLTSLEMESALMDFAARSEHKSSDSTFVVLMSHGILDNICGKNHQTEKPDVLAYDTIFKILNTKNCLNLKDKPKVIIIQACRGVNRGHVWVSDAPEITEDSENQQQIFEEDAVWKTHLEKDFITFCSSTPHNISWRDIENGSIFITELIHCFQQYSWCCHIEEIFRKVQNAFETPKVKAQMPTIERLSMTRYFYLFPGN
uniref:Caspase-1 n=1 Tax=Sarcophilus harrisii TaxID=9305 RepID=G3W251_SARHA